MLENISKLGKTLNKIEQKNVIGGRLSNTQEIEGEEGLCKNIIGFYVNTTSCTCANISENDELCAL
ncbi:hypothetical protein [Aquimarina sp. LLG6339-5]|uniref:hypothetical protein n=1 Tax=Aquimarina sp. LLG6339-5 TaxID=3160830 RepID=UPI0038650030